MVRTRSTRLGNHLLIVATVLISIALSQTGLAHAGLASTGTATGGVDAWHAEVQPHEARPGESRPRDSAARLRELAERLLSPEYPDARGRGTRAHLLVGELPRELADVPQPPNGRLLGSVVYSTGGRTAEGAAVLDVSGAPADVAAFYDRELTARGWRSMTEPTPPPGGFQPDPEPFIGDTYCKDPGEGWLWVAVIPRTALPNDVRLRVEPEPREATGASHGGDAWLN
jgi:hypothetical protein